MGEHMDRWKRGRELRKAVNQSIRADNIEYIKLHNGYWRAEVSFRESAASENSNGTFNWGVYITEYTIDFKPGVIEYNDGPVRNMNYLWAVDHRTYKWAIRKLEYYQVLQKIGENVDV
jgi:hypothetical protein